MELERKLLQPLLPQGRLFCMALGLGCNIAHEWGTADLQGSWIPWLGGFGVPECAASALEGHVV